VTSQAAFVALVWLTVALTVAIYGYLVYGFARESPPFDRS